MNDSDHDDANACLCTGTEDSSTGIPPMQGEGDRGEAERLRVAREAMREAGRGVRRQGGGK